jgi:3-oxoacyl-[acyl-carrier-protein] synthase-3
MRFNHVVIESLAYSFPDEIVSSASIEARLKPLYERLSLPEGRLELMTGIKSRRFWSHPIKPSEAATAAAKKALEKSQYDVGAIDVLIHAAVSRDCLEPATAAYIHRALGLSENTQFFDVSNACLGFLNAMILGASMIEQGHVRTVLIVAGENGKPLLEKTIETLLSSNLDRKEIKPYFANLTIGAGAVAMVLSQEMLVDRHSPKILAATIKADTASCELCEGGAAEGGGFDMQTDSEALLHAGLDLADKNWDAFKVETGWAQDTPNCVISHQVGSRHQALLYERLGLAPELDYSTFPFLGNVGSVSVPITLALAFESGAIHSGDSVALLGIGSGLSSIMMALEW